MRIVKLRMFGSFNEYLGYLNTASKEELVEMTKQLFCLERFSMEGELDNLDSYDLAFSLKELLEKINRFCIIKNLDKGTSEITKSIKAFLDKIGKVDTNSIFVINYKDSDIYAYDDLEELLETFKNAENFLDCFKESIYEKAVRGF